MTDGGMAQEGHTFGQKQPPLYVTIQKILDKYPDGQIFKVCVGVTIVPLRIPGAHELELLRIHM